MEPLKDHSHRASSIGLACLIILCIGLECILMVADRGGLGIARLRLLAYEYGGFWPGLLTSWKPNYTAQPYLMFFTYGFLHSGLPHLLINMMTLWSLGRAVADRVGAWGFWLLYAGSLFGGGVGYALLAPGLQPMVGASGALFGLAGGLLAWMYVDRFTYQQGLLPVAQAVVLLVVLNIILWWAMSGQLAWQTHLGGFVSGWIIALLIDPRATEFDDDVS